MLLMNEGLPKICSIVGEKRNVAVTRKAARTRNVIAPLVMITVALLLFSFSLLLLQSILLKTLSQTSYKTCYSHTTHWCSRICQHCLRNEAETRDLAPVQLLQWCPLNCFFFWKLLNFAICALYLICYHQVCHPWIKWKVAIIFWSCHLLPVISEDRFRSASPWSSALWPGDIRDYIMIMMLTWPLQFSSRLICIFINPRQIDWRLQQLNIIIIIWTGDWPAGCCSEPASESACTVSSAPDCPSHQHQPASHWIFSADHPGQEHWCSRWWCRPWWWKSLFSWSRSVCPANTLDPMTMFYWRKEEHELEQSVLSE